MQPNSQVPQTRRGCLFYVRRGCLSIALLVFGLIAVGFLFETVMRLGDADRYPAPGQLLDVDGYTMHLYCTGEGTPTVLLENGAGGFSAGWQPIQTALSQTTRVCSYDRAGYGWSQARPETRTAAQIVHELHTLLIEAGEVGPFVLVGASNGGLYNRAYAVQYPTETAGIVLVDATDVNSLADIRGIPAIYEGIKIMGRLGIFRLFPNMIYPGATAPEALKPMLAVFRGRASEIDNVTREWDGLQIPAEIEALKARISTAGSLGDKPLVILVADQGGHEAGWDAVYRAETTALSSNHRYVLIEGGHGVTIEQPDLVIQSVLDVVKSIQTETALAQ